MNKCHLNTELSSHEGTRFEFNRSPGAIKLGIGSGFESRPTHTSERAFCLSESSAIARVLVCFDQVARFIVHANHSTM
jgi:hypothetical protein